MPQTLFSRSAVVLGVALIALSACQKRDQANAPSNRGAGGSTAGGAPAGAGGFTGGTGGSKVAGTGGITTSGGNTGGVDSGADGTSRPDANEPADGGKETSASDVRADVRADVSADLPAAAGCGLGSLCRSLQRQYAEAIARAKDCTVGAANACAHQIYTSLGCGGCSTFVSDRGELDALATRFKAADCERCFFGPDGTPDPLATHCHPIVCDDVHPVCMATASGKSSCVLVDGPPACPAGTTDGAPCQRQRTCSIAGKTCSCSSTAAVGSWFCF